MNCKVPLWKGGLKFSVWSHMFDVESSGRLFTCSEEIKRLQSSRWCPHEENYLYKLFFFLMAYSNCIFALKMPSRALSCFFLKHMLHIECKRQPVINPDAQIFVWWNFLDYFLLWGSDAVGLCYGNDIFKCHGLSLALRTTFKWQVIWSSSINWLKW